MAGILEAGSHGRRPNGALLSQIAGLDPLAPLPASAARPMGNGALLMAQLGGMPNSQPMQLDVPQVNLPPAAPAPSYSAPHRSKGQIIAGIIADGLAGFVGNPPAVAQRWAAENERARDREEQQAQWHTQRRAQLDDYRAKKDIDQQYPSERAPYRWEANDGSLMEMGPDGQPRLVFKDPTPKMQAVQGFDEQGNPVMRFIAPPSSAPPVPQRLTTLPPNARRLSNGGPASQAPGGFPYSR